MPQTSYNSVFFKTIALILEYVKFICVVITDLCGEFEIYHPQWGLYTVYWRLEKNALITRFGINHFCMHAWL